MGRKGALEADLHWPGSEVWYEENLSAMLRCVDLSRALVDAHGPARNSLMQLKVTALASTRLCKELSAWIQRPRGSSELSPERLAEAMDSGRVRNAGAPH